MLQINLRRILADRGIERLIPYLQKIGIPRHTANKMLNERSVYLNLEFAERICLALKCSPGDLLEWQPEAGAEVAADHPLQKLRPKAISLNQQLRDLTPEQLAEVQQYISTLKG